MYPNGDNGSAMAGTTEQQYCLVQSNLDPIQPGILKAAFRAVAELVDNDAKMLASDAFGILADGLSAETARIVAGQLAQAGIHVDVVPQGQIPNLPGPHILRRCGCWPEAFMATDSLGRDVPVDWSGVLLISAGIVPLREAKRIINTRPKIRLYVWAGPLPATYVVPEREASIRYRSEARGLLDIVVRDEPYRYRIRADKFNYNYLGERQTNNKMENFTELVGDVVSYATGAALNRGAVAIRDEGLEAKFSYPSEHAFEEETIWLLYRFAQSRGRPWPWMNV